MRVLVTGASGQLGRALQDTAPAEMKLLHAGNRLDITDADAVLKAVRALKPDLVVNAAAYTAVDKAESDADSAFRVNRDGAAHLAAAVAQMGGRLIQVSTDFVFDGLKNSPYRPNDPTGPLNVYGSSKLAGERAVQIALNGSELIVRTAWVHYPGGHNFVRTMLRAMRERAEVRVVADQIGTPTYASGLASALWALHANEARGIHHWTDAGTASWYDFAVGIRDLAAKYSPEIQWAQVVPIRSDEYPTPAKRPSYSVLDKAATWTVTGVAPHWRECLERSIEHYLASRSAASSS